MFFYIIQTSSIFSKFKKVLLVVVKGNPNNACKPYHFKELKKI